MKISRAVAIIILIFILFFSGLFIGRILTGSRDNKNHVLIYQDKKVITPAVHPTPPSTNIFIDDRQYSGWKTYSSGSFTFRYPDDWTVGEPVVLGSGWEAEFNYNSGKPFYIREIINYNQTTGSPYASLDEFIGDNSGADSVEDYVLDGKPARFMYSNGEAGHVIPFDEIVAFTPDAKYVLVLYYQPDIYDEKAGTFNGILTSFKFAGSSEGVLAIRLNACCSCPGIVPNSIIGSDGWVTYEEYTDPQGRYASYTPRGCQEAACSPCPPEPEQGITQDQLDAGWYWSSAGQRLLGTPDNWVYQDAGRSSCWKDPKADCTF